MLGFRLAVDSRHVYWANDNYYGPGVYEAIGRANLDGTSPDPTFITGVLGAFGVAVDSNCIY